MASHSCPQPSPRVLHAAIARELGEMRQRLELLAETLAGDAIVAQRHIGQLQSFDYLIQHADECIALLERVAAGGDAQDAIGRVRLDAVQDRLRATILEG